MTPLFINYKTPQGQMKIKKKNQTIHSIKNLRMIKNLL